MDEHSAFLFHVCPAERLPAIICDGLRPGCESQFDSGLLRPGCVYLCNRATAEGPGQTDHEWGDAIVRVRFDALDPALLVADEENWRGLGPDGQTESYWDSDLPQDAATLLATFPQMDSPDLLRRDLTEQFATIAYRGSIPASAIEIELLPDRPDLPELLALRGDPA
jgi:hypothetical protein